MKLSVIVASYKRPDFLVKCIDSFSAQTRKPDEFIVVIRPEDTESEKVINERLSNVKKVYVREPGVVLAENAGLQAASGDIICFIDDDAIAESHWLERIEQRYQDKTIGAVGGPVIRMVNDQPIIKYCRHWRKIFWFGLNVGDSESIPKNLQEVHALRGCNMSFRKELMKPFDTNLRGYWRFEDDETMIVIEKGYKAVCDPDILVYHYAAPVQVEYRRSSLDKTSIICAEHNNTYVFLKHRRLFHSIPFLLFTFLCGDIHNVGFFMLIAHFIHRPRFAVFTNWLPWAFQGKWQGIQTYFRTQQ